MTTASSARFSVINHKGQIAITGSADGAPIADVLAFVILGDATPVVEIYDAGKGDGVVFWPDDAGRRDAAALCDQLNAICDQIDALDASGF